MKHYDPAEFARTPEAASDTVDRPFRLWPRVLSGVSLVVLLVIGCGGWGALAQLEGAVVTSGTVKVD
jgi:HlyD family secretion protein